MAGRSRSLEARIVEVTTALNGALAIEARRLGVANEVNPYRQNGCGVLYTTVYEMAGGRRSVELYVSNGAGAAWRLCTFDSAAAFFRYGPLLGSACGFFRMAVETALRTQAGKE